MGNNNSVDQVLIREIRKFEYHTPISEFFKLDIFDSENNGVNVCCLSESVSAYTCDEIKNNYSEKFDYKFNMILSRCFIQATLKLTQENILDWIFYRMRKREKILITKTEETKFLEHYKFDNNHRYSLDVIPMSCFFGKDFKEKKFKVVFYFKPK